VGRIAAAGTVACLAALETLGWAQAPEAVPEPGRGLGIAAVAGAIVLLVGGVVAAAKAADRRRLRAEDDRVLEARVSDALMVDPALAGLPVTAHVARSGWGGRAPTRVEVTGTVTSRAAEQAALQVIAHQVLPARPGAHIESHLAVDPTWRRRAA
jgi:hypothetical protein